MSAFVAEECAEGDSHQARYQAHSPPVASPRIGQESSAGYHRWENSGARHRSVAVHAAAAAVVSWPVAVVAP